MISQYMEIYSPGPLVCHVLTIAKGLSVRAIKIIVILKKSISRKLNYLPVYCPESKADGWSPGITCVQHFIISV